MDQKDKIVQITGSGEVLYALSAEGKLYMGVNDEKKGFEWRKVPEMNLEKMHSVKAAEYVEENTGPVFVAPEGGIKTAALIKDEEPKEEPKAEAPKAEPAKPAAPAAAAAAPVLPKK